MGPVGGKASLGKEPKKRRSIQLTLVFLFWEHSDMLGQLRPRGRSLSPDFRLPRHADSLIRQSRALSMERDSLFVPSMHTSTIVCSALSPWSKTGAFYYPRYPESWRGTACSLPRTGYLLPTLSSYRNATYRPSFASRYKTGHRYY